MYNSYPYRTCYDQLIDSNVTKVITSAMSLSSEKFGKLPQIHQKTSISGKEKRVLVPAANLQDIIQHYAQKLSNTVETPYNVVLCDITEQVSLVLHDMSKLIPEHA